MKIKSHKIIEVGEPDITLKYAEDTFNELLAFQGYGFCKAHATSYAVYSAVQLWLQEHYFLEYMATLMTHVDRAKEKKGVAMLDERVMYCLRHGVSILYPDVNRSTTRWEIIEGAKLLAPLANIKGFSVADTELVMANRPYKDINDFLDKTQFGKGKVEALLFAGALSKFGDVTDLYNFYYNDYCNKNKKKATSATDFFDFGDAFKIKKEEKEKKSFTEEELQDKQYEMNGFQVDENLIIKYHRIYEEGLKHFTKDDCKTKIYRIREAIEAPVASTWVLGKIRSIQMDKWHDYRITLTDGIDFYSFKLKNQDYNSSCFKRNSVCVFPFYKEVERDGDEIISIGTMFYSRYNAEKKDIFKIE